VRLDHLLSGNKQFNLNAHTYRLLEEVEIFVDLRLGL
jgi:hypothetical protein